MINLRFWTIQWMLVKINEVNLGYIGKIHHQHHHCHDDGGEDSWMYPQVSCLFIFSMICQTKISCHVLSYLGQWHCEGVVGYENMFAVNAGQVITVYVFTYPTMFTQSVFRCKTRLKIWNFVKKKKKHFFCVG